MSELIKPMAWLPKPGAGHLHRPQPAAKTLKITSSSPCFRYFFQSLWCPQDLAAGFFPPKMVWACKNSLDRRPWLPKPGASHLQRPRPAAKSLKITSVSPAFGDFFQTLWVPTRPSCRIFSSKNGVGMSELIKPMAWLPKPGAGHLQRPQPAAESLTIMSVSPSLRYFFKTL